MKNIQHIFFDLDHTLWDFEKNSALTFQQIFIDENMSLSFNDFITIYKPINLRYWKLFRDEKINKKDLRYYRLKETFDALKYVVSDTLIDKIAINYIDFLPNNNHLFDGTVELLAYLKSKYQLHIITNGFEEVQTKKMTSSGLSPYFKQVITSESVHVKKPNPKIFEFALQVSGANAGNSLMIGDSIEADINGALSVGMQAIHCNFENEIITDNNFISVKSLSELKQYL